MADIFSTNDAVDLLKNKRILFIGDSNIRASYKDMVALLCENKIVRQDLLRRRGENNFCGDNLRLHSGMTRGRDYMEAREFEKLGVHIGFMFITRCYDDRTENLLNEIKNKTVEIPDVIIMHSAIWDITRWGPNGVDEYKKNMQKLMKLLKASIPKSTLFIWMTGVPVSSKIRGLFVKQISFFQKQTRFEIMEANLFCRNLVANYGYDIVDAHYYLRNQIHRRNEDGVHYGPLVVRFLTNMFLTHIALSWNVKLPGNFHGESLKRIKKLSEAAPKIEKIELPQIPICLIPNQITTPPNNNQKHKRKFKKGPILAMPPKRTIPSLGAFSIDPKIGDVWTNDRQLLSREPEPEFWKDTFENNRPTSSTRFENQNFISNYQQQQQQWGNNNSAEMNIGRYNNVNNNNNYYGSNSNNFIRNNGYRQNNGNGGYNNSVEGYNMRNWEQDTSYRNNNSRYQMDRPGPGPLRGDRRIRRNQPY